MNQIANRVTARIAKETQVETKARVHAEFRKRMENYELQKRKELQKKKEDALTKITAFKLTEADHIELRKVSGMLGITPSEFVRDSIKEACMVMNVTLGITTPLTPKKK